MASSSKSRSNAPVLPVTFSLPRSLSPPRRYSHSSTTTSSSQPSDPFSYSSSSFASSSSASSLSSSIFERPSSPTRVNLSSTTTVPSFRISLNRSHSPNSRVSIRDQVVSKPAITKRTCMCSPTNHPGSFRCAIHRNNSRNGGNSNSHSVSCSPSRLNLRRSAMTNSLVRIGTVEGDWVKRALTALIRPSSHQQKRRFDFQFRPSRLSIMSKANDDDP
ncbi:hypothetical protein BVRB_2g030890 [Beta vulgaris subsp. vulgaris]|uniref:uncharacterized serine-rich protein C215.13 n=1 Tax=Beta vulgaris subsp. vulgaris TaxID=3555 RepID=UPI00053F7D0B|nr:uncharacterized serine-rich protein C215.13 [Beta vulgaris subsp. vulgaris]XP_057248689.1 uncharacterized serine-rich protein C215.13 [Beta vulgaris subsp. vulgaris]KMT18992.1 hypothetical protein BVRB_2g030890 [Beta vulgaris subsp. vulgaris]